jgi:hypothetical protein
VNGASTSTLPSLLIRYPASQGRSWARPPACVPGSSRCPRLVGRRAFPVWKRKIPDRAVSVYLSNVEALGGGEMTRQPKPDVYNVPLLRFGPLSTTRPPTPGRGLFSCQAMTVAGCHMCVLPTVWSGAGI